MSEPSSGGTDVATETLPELEVFVVDDDGHLHGEEEDQLPTALDIIRMVRDAALEIHNQAKADRAMATANRPGPSMQQSDRKGAGDDVIHAVRADPEIAITAMLDATPLSPPIRGLQVTIASRVADHRGVTWKASVRPPFSPRRRRARLRVYPSPSTNITFIELIPDRPRRRRSAGFIRAGNRITEILGNRLIAIGG
ncbi:MAG: hypothetical protein AAF480_06280 [Actinomycetota bacterium]